MNARSHRIVEFRLVTQDMRLVAFYEDVLGFVVDGPEQRFGALEMSLLGLKGEGRRRGFTMGEQHLSIDEYENAGRPYPSGSDAASSWFQHLALVVPDIEEAFERLRHMAPISVGGPQQLPPASGGARAYKFRDPDGHPLELLEFPPAKTPPAWRGRQRLAAQIALGIDHSAISVTDAVASIAFYEKLGLTQGDRTGNRGQAQENLDDLRGDEVFVVPMKPAGAPPHVELLAYRTPRADRGPPLRANDVAATRIVWSGTEPGLFGDPDGHLQQIQPA